MARPVEWTDELKSALLDDFINYVEEQDIPIIAEFCAKHHVYKQRLYEWTEFADSIKWCITKKEGALESMGLTKQIDTTMAIFSLKQLGWTDKQEISGPNGKGVYDTLSDSELEKMIDDEIARRNGK